jgi:hypothetical protein
MFLPLRTSQDKNLHKLLVEQLRFQILPLLDQLQFKPFPIDARKQKGFPTNYFRRTINQVTVINFQWRSNGTPQFIINFEIISLQEKLQQSLEGIDESWFIAPKSRISSSKSSTERWFKIGHIARTISANYFAAREIQKVKMRLMELDEFSKTGKYSPYFRLDITK